MSAVLNLFDSSHALAKKAYRRFVNEGVHQPSPWDKVTGQIFLGRPEFLERIERLVRGQPLANVPTVQTRPIRPSSEDVLTHVAETYRLDVEAVLNRSHRDAYQTAVYLLRRAANEPLQTVALRFRISPSRVSKIQKAIEMVSLSPQQVRAFAKCKVKN